MASASFGDSDDDLISNRRHRLNGYDIVYTRRTGKKLKKACCVDDQATCTTSLTENPAPVIPSAGDAEVSCVPGTAVTEGLRESSATDFPIVSRSTEAISSDVLDRARVTETSLDAPLREEVRAYNGQSTYQEPADRNEDVVNRLPVQVQHELHILSVNDDSCSEQNGEAKGNALNESPDDMRPSSFMDGKFSKNYLTEATDLELSQISAQQDKLNGELMPDSTERDALVDGQGCGEPLSIANFGEMIRFNLGKRSFASEIDDLNQKLIKDLQSVRSMVNQFETKEVQLASSRSQLSNNKHNTNGSFKSSEAPNNVDYDHSQPHGRPDLLQKRLFLKVNPETGSAVQHEGRSMGLSRVNSDIGIQRNLGPPTSYNRQLSVAVMETSHRLGEFSEKEKRTPKANQFYRNTEFLLGKDRLPPESNKRLKTGSGRKYIGDSEHALRFGFGFDKVRNQVFRSCSSLLQRLMKHKFGWVFNAPVDAKQLGLVDYHDVIKHPMDLGTIKGRLSKNWYKSPMEFAEDVRLTFRNAMTYNPKGQDVHIMAEQLLLMFEERWAVIETEYNEYFNYQLYKDGRLPTTASRKAPEQSHFNLPFSASATAPVSAFVPSNVQPSSFVYASISSHAPDAAQNRILERRGPVSTSVTGDPRTPRSHFGRMPAPKKPKAKDTNKRDMTQDEKQKLSKHLQDLPMDKLDAIVQIIKKRNTALSQHDDEIEVDIDSVDPETLWELDRFVSNYKKRLSKNKRKAELGIQARAGANSQSAVIASSTPAKAGIQRENGDFEKSINRTDGEKREAYNECSSSSSSSDSGSSSSDSDSDSSSGDGSDAGDSPRT